MISHYIYNYLKDETKMSTRAKSYAEAQLDLLDFMDRCGAYSDRLGIRSGRASGRVDMVLARFSLP
jgi:hypothetical protein